MNATRAFFVASACLCLVLAAYAGPLFDWSNRLTRKLGFSRLADFRERLRRPLLPVARAVLVLAAVIILVAAWKLRR